MALRVPYLKTQMLLRLHFWYAVISNIPLQHTFLKVPTTTFSGDMALALIDPQNSQKSTLIQTVQTHFAAR